MQRQDLDADALAFVEQQRAYHKSQADRGDDDYLDAEHRRNRAQVLGPRCRVQLDDDVLIEGKVRRVIGPARGEGSFYALVQNAEGRCIDVPFDGQLITDRAPADPLEEPLPIFEEPAIEDDDPADEPEQER